jgi:hypothetical protein
MKYIILITSLVLAAASLFAADPTSGQWKFEKKNAGAGFTLFGVTPEVSKAFGLDGSGNLAMLTVGSGTVTSVSLTAPEAIFDVSGSPVTTSGGFTITFDSQNANTVFAGPTNGAAAQPTMRALVEADVPSLSASKITSGTVAPARLGSGTANSTTFLRGDSTWQTVSSGGGVESPGDEVAYVYPETGNDTTGDGTQATPWATIQKAVTEGKSIIVLGEGAAGNITMASDITITITGMGAGVSSIGSVTSTSSSGSISLSDGGFYSFTVTGNISSAPASSGSNGGNIILSKIYAPARTVICSGIASSVLGQNGGFAGSATIDRCIVGSILAEGGAGIGGDSCTAGSNGGDGGSVTVTHSYVNSNIQGTGGTGGSDGGAGAGANGSNGALLTSRWSELVPTDFSTFNTNIIHACLVGGTWTD